MGVVYSARDRELDRQVALKVLATAVADAESTDRLRREARIIAGLEHPGIVPVHDVGSLPDGRVFYAMKLVSGQRLDAFLGGGRPLPEKLRVFLRVCEPVAFAHAHGVIHRDLKPENVMVGPFGEVLVMDWGVAKRLEDGDAVGPAARARGSSAQGARAAGRAAAPPTAPSSAPRPGWRPSRPAARWSAWTPGPTSTPSAPSFITCSPAVPPGPVTRRRPPPAPAPGPATRGRGRRPSVPPRQLDPDLPRPLEAVCLKALAEEPAGRYANAALLAADVALFLEGAPGLGLPGGAVAAGPPLRHPPPRAHPARGRLPRHARDPARGLPGVRGQRDERRTG